ncbi:MAG TPA: efflux RND transporter periplasmic adaptor subunit [Thermoanaerobaculia bacterium]
MSKKAIWIAIVVVGAVGLYFAIAGRKKSEPKYRTTTVDRGAITQTVTASGTLSAVITVQVGSQVSGIISKLHADFNSKVKKGDPLAELDPTPFQAQVEQQRAALVKAQVDLLNDQIALTRQKRLLDEGLAAQSDYDSAKAAHDGAAALVEQAKASLAQAETNLKYTKIISPIDGVVVARAFDVGQTVAASFQAPTLFTIAQDLTKMQVSADVSESDIGQVKVGQPVRFNVDAYPEREFRGSVSQIRLNATVNQNVVTYPVIVEVANTDLALKPTMTANVTIDVATVKDVLRVPNSALRWRPEEKVTSTPEEKAAKMAQNAGAPGGAPAAANRQMAMTRSGGGPGAGQGPKMTGTRRPQSNVYIVGPNGEPKQVEIRAGISDGRYTEVVSGSLNVGEPVIIGLATTKADAGSAARPPSPGGSRRF